MEKKESVGANLPIICKGKYTNDCYHMAKREAEDQNSFDTQWTKSTCWIN
jgi:hypothetical protein